MLTCHKLLGFRFASCATRPEIAQHNNYFPALLQNMFSDIIMHSFKVCSPFILFLDTISDKKIY